MWLAGRMFETSGLVAETLVLCNYLELVLLHLGCYVFICYCFNITLKVIIRATNFLT